MLTPYEYIKEHLPHLHSCETVDPLDMQTAMGEYARYVAKITANELTDFEVNDEMINETLTF